MSAVHWSLLTAHGSTDKHCCISQFCCQVHSVLFNCRRTLSRKGWHGCLYLNPSGEPIQYVEIQRLSRPARSVTCACWSERDHYSNVSISRHLRKAVTKRTYRQCLKSNFSTTFMGITGIEDKQKRPRQSIFPLFGSGTFLQYGIAAAY
jgi:hypothetical protein